MLTASRPAPVIYPSSDGEPMAQNTEQYEWIVYFKENIDLLLPNAFVAGDLFWYPIEGNNRVRFAPDVMVAVGRPKGPRSSYKQWEEGGIAPQVVIEIWSPSNSLREMIEKQKFYETHGVQEFYTYTPETRELAIYVRQDGRLDLIPVGADWTSPVLGIRLVQDEHGLRAFGPDGTAFQTFPELQAQLKDAQARLAETAHQLQDTVHQLQSAEQRLATETARAEALAAKLRALGIEV